MTDSNEEVLRRSLDAVDRHRTWLVIGVVIAAIALLVAFYFGGQALHERSTLGFIHAVMLVLGIWTTIMTLFVVIQVTTMTKRILRAIELASRK
jgi:uncharacterized membrane protein